MMMEEELTNSAMCLSVDGRGLTKTNTECPTEVIQGGSKIKHMGDDYDKFYARLRNMYNMPKGDIMTESGQGSPTDPFIDIEKARDSLTSEARKFLKNMRRNRTEEKKSSRSSSDLIRYKWNENDVVECKSGHYDKLFSNQKPEFTKRSVNKEFSFPDDFDDKFPTLEDLPKDQEELEKLFFKYVERLEAMADSMQRRHPNPQPGTEESVLSYEYKLDQPSSHKDPTKAFLGERKCNCPEVVEINGDTANLKDLKLSIKELKSNHKVGAVFISVSKVTCISTTIVNSM